MSFLVNLAAGLLFGLGLVVSGMANPAKVLNFLDIFGIWDPSLAFVMGGAVAVAFLGFRLALQRQRPLLAAEFQVPNRRDLDARLLSGAALFGVGWGLGGFCPGPAIVALVSGVPAVFVFVASMLVGMVAFALLDAPTPASEPTTAAGSGIDG